MTGLLLLPRGVTAADLPAPLVDPYLQVHAALAQDSTDGVIDAAKLMAAQAGEMGAQGAKIQAAALKLQNAAALAAARLAFGDLSEELIAHGQATQASAGAGNRVAYCPMVKHSWLQKGEEIRNPYLGKNMPTCGALREILK